MLLHYFKIAIRNLSRQRLFTGINIFGLALSMSVCLIVLMRIKDDFSYDRFHPDADHTYRIITEVSNKEGNTFRLASSPLPLAPDLRANYPFIENTVRLYANGEKASNGKKELYIDAAFTEPSFFDVFGFRLESGDPHSALSAPNSIILTKRTAANFFGSINPIGQTLSMGKLGNYQVTGVLRDPPGKSHIDFEAYASMSTVAGLEKNGGLPAALDHWENPMAAYTYVVLRKNTHSGQLSRALKQVAERLMKKFNVTAKQVPGFDIQSLSKISPGEELGNSIGRGGNIGKTLAEIAIAFVILLSACFNYTNLSIARSLSRAKEVGIRKVNGARRSQLFGQFITESVFIALLSLGLAYVFLIIMRDYAPFSAELIPSDVPLDRSLAGLFVLFSLFTGLLAGALPAWALSGFRPVQVLKNLSTLKLFGGSAFRKGLIIAQFTLSLVIIIFTMTFKKQFSYMVNADYGFNKDNLLTIPLQGADYRLLSDKIAHISGVALVSASSDNLGGSASGTTSVKATLTGTPIRMNFYDTDSGFIANMQLKLLAGNTFHSGAATGKETEVIINENARRILQIPTTAEAIGKIILLEDSLQLVITGVLQDFHFQSFESPITPLLLRNRSQAFSLLNVRTVSSVNTASFVSALEKAWKGINPFQPFKYSWFREEFYVRHSAVGTSSFLSYLAAMTVTLACMGLLGMVVYTTETRKKEIGIRKVMGAGVAAILTLLTRNFLKLIVIAGLIALPIGLICGQLFLHIFAARVEMGFGILAGSFIGMLALALGTISFQIYRVAITNPVESLRAE